MDASYKIQRGIHVHLIQFFMCPEFWVHITLPIGGGLPLKRGLVMNQNINYIGLIILLRHLQSAGLVSRKEAGRIAARLRVETGADVIFSP